MKSSNISLPLHSNVDELHEWISHHPYFFAIPTKVLSTIFQSFRKAESIHKNDTRVGKGPYILHPIWLVEAIIQNHLSTFDPDDVIVLILHDTIEDHPECWQDILQTFGLSIFRDVLILTKIRIIIRREILSWFVKINNDINDPDIGKILQILGPEDPLIKYYLFSNYTRDILGQDSILFEKALFLYKGEILDMYENQDEAYDEYISLGNYLYFNQNDARRKLQDMLHNMSDMEIMESKNPGYIQKRRIKAYILGVQLKNFGMMDEYSHLEQAFQSSGYSMLHDREVSSKTSRSRKIATSK